MIEITKVEGGNTRSSMAAVFTGSEEDRMDCMMKLMDRTVMAESYGIDEPCWVWTMATTTGGSRGHKYSRVSMFGKDWYGHRLMYLIAYGELKPHMEIDHRCETSLCINPHHLQEITGELNNKLNHKKRV